MLEVVVPPKLSSSQNPRTPHGGGRGGEEAKDDQDDDKDSPFSTPLPLEQMDSMQGNILSDESYDEVDFDQENGKVDQNQIMDNYRKLNQRCLDDSSSSSCDDTDNEEI